MDLSVNTWYVGWFFYMASWFASSKIDQFKTNGTTLCQFIRIALFGGLIFIAAVLFLSWIVLDMLLVGPVMSLGWTGFLVLPTMILMVIIFFAVIGGMILLGRFIGSKISGNLSADPSTLSLIWQYIVAVKHKMCPIIKFK